MMVAVTPPGPLCIAQTDAIKAFLRDAITAPGLSQVLQLRAPQRCPWLRPQPADVLGILCGGGLTRTLTAQEQRDRAADLAQQDSVPWRGLNAICVSVRQACASICCDLQETTSTADVDLRWERDTF